MNLFLVLLTSCYHLVLAQDTIKSEITNEPTKSLSRNRIMYLADTLSEFKGIMPAPRIGWDSLLGRIHYPESARRAFAESYLRIEVIFDAAGVIQSVENRTSSPNGDAFFPNIAKAIKSTSWSPARQDGKPVSFTMEIPLLFYMESGRTIRPLLIGGKESRHRNVRSQ